MKAKLIAVAALATLSCGQVSAYEVETHAYLSGIALKASILANSPTKRSAIGLRFELNRQSTAVSGLEVDRSDYS